MGGGGYIHLVRNLNMPISDVRSALCGTQHPQLSYVLVAVLSI